MEAFKPAPGDYEVRSMLQFLNAQNIAPVGIHGQLVLVTEQLLSERVSGLQLTGAPAELRCIYALRLRRTNI